MDTTDRLQTPRTGRSRFSKALPLPPPSDNGPPTLITSQTPRNLPDMSTVAAFPPRKDSVGARFAPKPIDSPLPALPPAQKEPNLLKKMPSIPRKAVGSPPPAQPALQEPVSTKQLRRNSSISSLLSAYSGTSTDSVHRSSQSSSVTKGSDASLSPERDPRDDTRNYGTEYKTYSRNPYQEPSMEERRLKMSEPLPPPPPPRSSPALSEAALVRPGLSSTPRATTVRPARSPSGASSTTTSSQMSLGNASPQRREIWRRRASSKSDGSLLVTDLKLPKTNGSTAASAAASVTGSMQPVTSSLASSGAAARKISPLPPKPNSGLPGRNIRPPMDEALSESKTDTFKPSSQLANGDSPTVRVYASLISPVAKAPTVSTGASKATGDMVSIPTRPNPQSDSGNLNASQPQDNGASTRGMVIQKQASLHNLNGARSPNSADPSLRGARSAVDLRAQKQQQAIIRSSNDNNYTASQAQNPAQQMSPRRARGPSQSETARPTPQLVVTREGGEATEPVKYKDQEPIELSPREQKDLDEAIDKVVDSTSPCAFMFTPTEDGVWPAMPLTVNHYKCMNDHRQWHYTRNEHYPIRCMICSVADRHPRSVCKCCGVRVCHECAGAVRGKRLEDIDLEALKKARVAHSPIKEETEQEAWGAAEIRA